MYRRDLRMARGKGEVESRPVLRSHFVERVANLPMVHVALDYATNTYSSIKESNRIVHFTLSNAEKSVNFMAGQARPVVLKFEKQIQAVDDLACRGLGSLEQKVPIITKSPDKIIDDTRDLYENTIHNRFGGIVKYGNDKIKSVTDYGMSTVNRLLENPLVNSVIGTVDGALVTSEYYIDYFLPPENEDENNHVNSLKKETDDQQISPVTRATRMLTTIRRRSYVRVVHRVRSLQDRTIHLLNMPEHLISGLLDNFEDLNKYARTLWVTLNSDETAEEIQSRNLVSQKLFPIARPLLKQLVVLYISIAELVPLPTRKNKVNNTNNETNHTPLSINAGVQRLVGLIRVAPTLLPTYLYAFLIWINQKKEKEVTSNGSTIKLENNHSYENSTED